MKRLLYFLLLACVSLLSSARQLSLTEAIKRMETGGLSARHRVKARKTYQLAYTAQKEDKNLFFVINHEDNNGYTIVGADDLVPAVLGYSDSGRFTHGQLPVQLRSMLYAYEQSVFSAICEGKAIRYAMVQHEEVPYLVTSKWNQDAPYNMLCSDMGYQAPTGCVATAMAQVMYYHRWPEIGKGQNTYTCGNTTIFSRFADHSYQWDLMRDVYSPNDTDKSAEAVALLMRDCGVAVDMQYSPGASSSYSGLVPDALSSRFNYNSGMKINYKTFFTDEAWEQLMLTELDASRPVLYFGQTPQDEGHAFVLDGYDGHGYYHINWGWGGYCDGYFLILGNNSLTPEGSGIGGGTVGSGFIYDNVAITDIRKEEGTGSKPEPFLCAPNGFSVDLDPNNNINISIYIGNWGTATSTSAYIGIQYVAEGASAVNVGMGDFGMVHPMYGGVISYELQTENISDGVYTLVPVTSNPSAKRKTWTAIPLPAYYVCPVFEKKDGRVSILEYGGIKYNDGQNSDAIVNLHNTDSTLAPTPFFDLLGRPVSAPVRGLYIHNGRKVMRKD